MSEKTQKQRIEDAAHRLYDEFQGSVSRSACEQIALSVLEAADQPSPPLYPTDEMVRALHRATHGLELREHSGGVSFERRRRELAAVLAVDPIHQAAVECVHAHRYFEANHADSLRCVQAGRALRDAVSEAGL